MRCPKEKCDCFYTNCSPKHCERRDGAKPLNWKPTGEPSASKRGGAAPTRMTDDQRKQKRRSK